MTQDDIKLILAAGEGYNAEFKLSVPSKVKELSEEVCAFANAAGGVLLIGINDKNEVKGVNIDNSKRSAIQNSLGEITPSLTCTVQIVKVEGKEVGVIEVPTGSNKPYVLSGAVYVRIGPNTQKLTTAEQMRDFFQQAGKIYFDEVPCLEFDIEKDVDELFLTEFKTEANIGKTVPNEQFFRNMKLYEKNRRFKNGAVLFFGSRPEDFIEKAITRCISFGGTDKRFIVDDKVYGGHLVSQYRNAMDWLKAKLNVGYDIEGQGGGPRKEIWEIPETVFKEAIVNALAHRDYYDKGAVTTIELFEDRVQIVNPGGLVSAIPEKDFGNLSHSRNPLIFGLFAKMHLVEQVGSGIGRMRELMEAAKLKAPEFQKSGMFVVTFFRPKEFRISTTHDATQKTTQKSDVKPSEKPSEKKPSEKKPSEKKPSEKKPSEKKPSEKTSEKILLIVKSEPEITTELLALKLGRTNRAIEFQLKKLKVKGVLGRIGPDKGGYWKVNDAE